MKPQGEKDRQQKKRRAKDRAEQPVARVGAKPKKGRYNRRDMRATDDGA
ncbi:hypothetical protein [Paraburkholderia adhaesiva]|nr:hypothetical protein [Paraburkholderia adhaesiva]